MLGIVDGHVVGSTEGMLDGEEVGDEGFADGEGDGASGKEQTPELFDDGVLPLQGYS